MKENIFKKCITSIETQAIDLHKFIAPELQDLPNIYINWLIIFKGYLKSPFVGDGVIPFSGLLHLLLICTSYCWVLSKEVSSTILLVFSMTQPGTELTNILTIMLIGRYIYIRIYIYTRWKDKIVVLKKTTLQLYFKTFIENINSDNLIM